MSTGIQKGRGSYGSRHLEVIYGFDVCFLPDFLQDHTLLDRSPRDRLREHCRRWNQLIAGLWTDDASVAYGLLFRCETRSPAAGLQSRSTGISLFIRCAAPRGEQCRDEFLASLRTMQIPAIPMKEVQGVSAMPTTILPIEPRHQVSLFEIRQEDRIIETPLQWYGQVRPAYCVLPWWGAGGPFHQPMEALMAQDSTVNLLVLMKPTRLHDRERAYLAEMATLGAVPRQQPKGRGESVADKGGGEADPQARWMARLHAANLRRLSKPFVVAAYTIAEASARGAARTVALALAACISEERPFETPLGEATPLESQTQVQEYNGQQYHDMATGLRTLRIQTAADLLFDDDRMLRLRYLTDATGAATAFRLPVNTFGGVPGITVRQQPPDVHPGPHVTVQGKRQGSRDNGSVYLGKYSRGGDAVVPVEEFGRHVLVAGTTGSGKTTTILNILHQLWNDHDVPFLVIESAKREYRGLLGVKGWNTQMGRCPLRVFTLGNESVSPLRLNPFELLPGVSLESHLGRLQVCLEASMPQFGVLPSVLADALEQVYRIKKWQLQDVGPAGRKEFPTLEDLYNIVPSVVKERRYHDELERNITAAAQGRIKTMRMGSKGVTFDAGVVPSAADAL